MDGDIEVRSVFATILNYLEIRIGDINNRDDEKESYDQCVCRIKELGKVINKVKEIEKEYIRY